MMLNSLINLILFVGYVCMCVFPWSVGMAWTRGTQMFIFHVKLMTESMIAWESKEGP